MSVAIIVSTLKVFGVIVPHEVPKNSISTIKACLFYISIHHIQHIKRKINTLCVVHGEKEELLTKPPYSTRLLIVLCIGTARVVYLCDLLITHSFLSINHPPHNFFLISHFLFLQGIHNSIGKCEFLERA